MEVQNIDNLIEELKELRDKWKTLLTEAKRAAKAMSTDLPTETTIPEKRIQKRELFHDETSEVQLGEETEERDFKVNVCFVQAC